MGMGQLQPAAAWLPVCPDPLMGIMGIMVAPAGMPNAAPGDAATASIRNKTAHTLFRIIIIVLIHNCDFINLSFVAEIPRVIH
jgi:hypothetical protein